MYHPDLERFRANRINLINYDADELDIDDDYSEWDEKKIELELSERRRKFTTDIYPDEGFTPDGWLRKQNYIDKSEKNSEFMNAFMPEYDEDACKAIQAQKDKYCKDEEDKPKKSPTACKQTDDGETLKKKHDHLMLCRNIRLIETFSHCKTGDKWFKSKAANHMSQLNELARSAIKCVDYYRNKQPFDQRIDYKPKKKRRTIPRRIKRSKKKSRSKSKSFNRR